MLGTDAGGIEEIVEPNVTGLLHSLGRPSAHDHTIAAIDQNYLLLALLEAPSSSTALVYVFGLQNGCALGRYNLSFSVYNLKNCL